MKILCTFISKGKSPYIMTLKTNSRVNICSRYSGTYWPAESELAFSIYETRHYVAQVQDRVMDLDPWP